MVSGEKYTRLQFVTTYRLLCLLCTLRELPTPVCLQHDSTLLVSCKFKGTCVFFFADYSNRQRDVVYGER